MQGRGAAGRSEPREKLYYQLSFITELSGRGERRGAERSYSASAFACRTKAKPFAVAKRRRATDHRPLLSFRGLPPQSGKVPGARRNHAAALQTAAPRRRPDTARGDLRGRYRRRIPVEAIGQKVGKICRTLPPISCNGVAVVLILII